MDWTTEKAAEELLRVLPQLKSVVAAEMRESTGEGTTLMQFRVLSQLAEGPLTMSTLAKHWRVSLQSMSGLVQSLVERGWIERLPDPRDRRQQLLQLTERGLAHHAQAQAQIMDRMLPMIEKLSPQELQAVEQALPALERVFRQEESTVAVPPEEATV